MRGAFAPQVGGRAGECFRAGTMAQLLILRVLADRARCRRIAMHPRSHLEESERGAYHELYGLASAALGALSFMVWGLPG